MSCVKPMLIPEERIKIIRFLIKNGINLKIVGGRWGSEFKEFCLGYLSPEEAVKIINQSKIIFSTYIPHHQTASGI